ncbi:MAG: phosphate ABC transporter permease PstA [Candidatus Eisenbacteria sp.]|nr:phosphate ABC transporter permease PstA [Candidatus Eisenbacteria bacterium]
MKLHMRKILDKSFSGLGFLSISLMAASLLVILTPIFVKGFGAFVFQGTVEFRRLQLEKFERGNRADIEREVAAALRARQPVYDMIAVFEERLQSQGFLERNQHSEPLGELKDALRELLGPFPDEPVPIMPRDQYGQTRWDRAQEKIAHVLYRVEYDHSDPARMGTEVLIPREEDFRDTSLEPLFRYVEENAEKMLLPRLTVYPRFLTDKPIDSHFFGGIWPEVLGTLCLTLGAMLCALPMGVISAIYLVEYAGESQLTSFLRTCVSTLAGVPSIVFGLFGLAFFINTLHITHGKSLLVGCLTLALLILPTIIRVSEEAIQSVSPAYKEAALSLGASRWRTVVTVILPASLPGILTGSVISMGRAAGETAPIIFTAAVSVGKALDFAKLQFWQTCLEATPALPWNIYNLATEHEAVDEIRHVQFGMVFTLIVLVLVLNAAAILMRARIAKKLKG